MQNNNGTSHEEVVNVEEYLEKLGLTQAVDAFLFKPDMHDLYHNLFVGSCEDLKAQAESMPEDIRDILLERMDNYESVENVFIEASICRFKKYLAEVIYLNEDLMGDVTGVAQCYKVALEAHSDALEKSAMEVAESIMEDLVESYKSTWLGYLRDVDNHESKKAILSVVLGDKIPGIENSIVVEVDVGELMRAHEAEDDEDDGKDGEEDGEE